MAAKKAVEMNSVSEGSMVIMYSAEALWLYAYVAIYSDDHSFCHFKAQNTRKPPDTKEKGHEIRFDNNNSRNENDWPRFSLIKLTLPPAQLFSSYIIFNYVWPISFGYSVT